MGPEAQDSLLSAPAGQDRHRLWGCPPHVDGVDTQTPRGAEERGEFGLQAQGPRGLHGRAEYLLALG